MNFSLLWTIGFSGKRFFDAEESAVSAALKQAINFLCGEAHKESARLTAVSSLARGGDVLFAEALREPNDCRMNVQWKCLLPFAWEKFIEFDLAGDASRQPLPPEEARHRRDRAGQCLSHSTPPPLIDDLPRHIDPADPAQRDEAYLECGYRTVDESDVMILLMRRAEIEQLGQPENRAAERAGTLAIARYALAAQRPMVLLPVDAPDPWAAREFRNAPPEAQFRRAFVDPSVSEVVRRAKEQFSAGIEADDPGAPRAEVRRIQRCLGNMANSQRDAAQSMLKWILTLHLAATSIAAILATGLAREEPPVLKAALVALLALAVTKPLLVLAALVLARRLHRRGDKEHWLQARVLAELCRGAVATWLLPIQPLDASDEEDFPKVKRLIRTLRLLREEDQSAAHSGAAPIGRETPVEANMREACARYIEDRLNDQARHYRGQLERAKRQARRWRVVFWTATFAAVAVGALLAVEKFYWASHGHLLVAPAMHWLEASIIIAPFVAAYSLGLMTILDCSRRCHRYAEMAGYLERLADTLARTRANPSRLRLIEHAERLMIEEQHEWFSVMRNLSV